MEETTTKLLLNYKHLTGVCVEQIQNGMTKITMAELTERTKVPVNQEVWTMMQALLLANIEKTCE